MCKGKTDNVTCQICNQTMSFGRIKKHIKFNHEDINLENYIQKYYQTLPLHNPCIICKKNIVYKYKTCSKECRNLLINPSKGKPKLGAGGKGISRNKGNILTQEHKDKISKSKKGKKHNMTKTRKDKNIPRTYHVLYVVKAKSKPVLQYDLKGNFVKEWNSGAIAAKELNMYQSNINSCCNGKINSSKGYIWKFKTT